MLFRSRRIGPLECHEQLGKARTGGQISRGQFDVEMDDAEFLGDALFRPPPAEIRVLTAQIDQAFKTMGAQKTAVKPQIRLGASRHVLRDPVQMIEPVEQSGHDLDVDAVSRAGKARSEG